ELPLRTPTIGIAGCCASAKSGQDAADPATTLMNSRRLMGTPGGSNRVIVATPKCAQEEVTRETKSNVRFGSKADICSAKRHVRFTPNSDINCVFRHVR